MRRKIVVINGSTLGKNPRFMKIVKMLKEAGFDVTAISQNRKAQPFSFSYDVGRSEEVTTITLHLCMPQGLHSLPFLPFWWYFIAKVLLRSNFDLIHVINFYSILPSILVAKIKGKPIVYDVEDVKIDHTSFCSILRSIGIGVEKFFMKFVKAIVVVDELQIYQFNGIPNPNITAIYDSPSPFKKPGNLQREGDEVFRIFYAGYLTKRRNLNLDLIIQSIRDIEGVKLLIAGEGDLVDDLKVVSFREPQKVVYLGWLPYKKVLELSLECSLLFSLREPTPLNQKYICGSKFLEATMCGKPFLVNKGTSTAVKTIRNKCGIVVDAHNPEEIKKAILKLKNDKEFCTKLAINAKKAYEQKYGWKIMKQRLLNLYSEILNKD